MIGKWQNLNQRPSYRGAHKDIFRCILFISQVLNILLLLVFRIFGNS